MLLVNAVYAPVPVGLLFLLVGVNCSLSTGTLPVTSSSFPNPSLNTGLKALIITGLCNLSNCLNVFSVKTPRTNENTKSTLTAACQRQNRGTARWFPLLSISVLHTRRDTYTATQACQQPRPCSASLPISSN